MIAYIKGILTEMREDSIVVEASGIGYNILVPATVIEQLPPPGSEVKVHTYTYVREDAFLLYGFASRDDLKIFKQCITVSGIGPKGALAILSVMDADALRFAILAGDAKTVSKAPGIGAKTAQRLILELKDKVRLEDTLAGLQDRSPGKEPAGSASDMNSSAKKEAVEALVALGYSSTEALKAVNQIEFVKDMDSEAILKAALKNLF